MGDLAERGWGEWWGRGGRRGSGILPRVPPRSAPATVRRVALHEVEVARSPLRAALAVPPSKSLQQRALALALLADGRSQIVAEGAPAGDVLVFAAAASALADRDVPPA